VFPATFFALWPKLSKKKQLTQAEVTTISESGEELNESDHSGGYGDWLRGLHEDWYAYIESAENAIEDSFEEPERLGVNADEVYCSVNCCHFCASSGSKSD
jgi:hypothetical protein